MDAEGPPPKKLSKQLRISVFFKPRSEESAANFLAEVENSGEATSCADSSNANRSREDQYTDSDTIGTFIEEQEIDYIPVNEIWSEQQKQSFLHSNKWLLIESGKLGCALCKQFDSLGPYITQGQHVSKEWASSQIALTVGKSGQQEPSDAANMKAIRNKIYKHRPSQAHKSVQRMLTDGEEDCMGQEVLNSQRRSTKTTIKCLRTAYYVAKRNRLFSDYESLISLQETNEMDLGTVLHGRTTCTSMHDQGHIKHHES